MIVVALFAMVATLQSTGEFTGRAGAPARPSNVRATYAVEPDTVRVGDPATLRIIVRAPAGSRITFPAAVDSTAAVEPLDPVSVREETKDGIIEATGTYRFLAWDLGLPVISIGAIKVEKDGHTEELQLDQPRVFVMTVLPADSTQRRPKPERGIVFLHMGNWPWWLLIVGAFAIVIIPGVYFGRRRREPKVVFNPFADARREFGRLNTLDLVGAGEGAKHVGASVDIMRAFLAARNPKTGVGLTTDELLGALAEDGAVPLYRVADLLKNAEGIKFAGASVETGTAVALGNEAAAIVAETHRVDVERAKAMKQSRRKKTKKGGA